MIEKLETAKKHIDSAVNKMNDKLFGANWKHVADTAQEVVYAQVEIDRALHEIQFHDLQKNPQDVPNISGGYLVLIDFGDGGTEVGIGAWRNGKWFDAYSVDCEGCGGSANLYHDDVRIVKWRDLIC